jgi:hypothetical protein
MTKLMTALLLRATETGTHTSAWQSVSGSKVGGLLMILFAVLGYALGELSFEAASAAVAGGFGIIRLRDGQSRETQKVTDHLSDQDLTLKKQAARLEEILKTVKSQ